MAFGLGWLVSSLMPATQREQELVVDLRDKAMPAQDAVAETRGTGSDSGDSGATSPDESGSMPAWQQPSATL